VLWLTKDRFPKKGRKKEKKEEEGHPEKTRGRRPILERSGLNGQALDPSCLFSVSLRIDPQKEKEREQIQREKKNVQQ